MSDTQTESPESRLKAAGFTQRLGFWVTPDGTSVLNLADAIAGLDSGEIAPGGPTMTIAAPAVALPDELVDRACPPPQNGPPEPPPWLVAQARVIAAETVRQMKPVVRAEVRAELRKAAKA
jgi:hypothetical protein